MRRTLAIILVLIVLLVTVMFCGLIDQLEQDMRMSISVKEGTLSKTNLTYVITNTSEDKLYQYGHGYVIEQWSFFGWTEYHGPQRQTTTAELMVIQPGEVREYTIDWSVRYGELPLGWYRIGKAIEAEVCDGGNVPVGQMVYAEFFIWS